MGKAPRLSALSRDKPKPGAPTLKRFCPNGANSVAPAYLQRPLPLRGKAASPNARLRRRQAPAPEPAAVCSCCRSNRNETQRPCPLLVGHGRVCTEPKALEAGTADRTLPPARLRRSPHHFADGGRSLLVGLPPSTPAVTPAETKRSAHAPCSWGMGASARSRRRWKPALPAGPPGARRPPAPAEQGIAAPALKTPAYRLFFPLCAVLPIFSVQGHAIEPQLRFRSRFCTEGIIGQQGEMTLPCPTGKGRCRCAYSTLFAPAGQKRFRVGAPDFGDIAERVESWGALPIRYGRQARRGMESRRTSNAGMGATLATALLRPQKPAFRPSARPISPGIPRGERRALPAPAQGINPLGIPFWGIGPPPPVPVPQNAAGGRPCA